VDDFSINEFSSNGISHRVYRKGAGPDVLVMHELPGMTPQFMNLARTVAEAGFTVPLPLFFGEPGEDHGVLSLVRRASMAVTDEDLARAQTRNKAGVRLMCLRFSNDRISPRERFSAIEAAFAANFDGIVIPSPDARWGIPANAHSVLTENFSDADGHPTRVARDHVIAFLKERLS
jgi:hypothetical protein